MDGGNLDLIAAAKQFLENYYRTFDANRTDLGNLYREESVMIFEGRTLRGKEAILAELTSLQQCRHQILTNGCQPTVLGSSDLLAAVSGNIWLDGKPDARLFAQGPPLAGKYDMGAICVQEHSEKLKNLLNDALDKGAR